MERTLVIAKPDAVHRHLIGRIVARLEEKGLRVAALKLQWLPRALVKQQVRVMPPGPSDPIADPKLGSPIPTLEERMLVVS